MLINFPIGVFYLAVLCKEFDSTESFFTISFFLEAYLLHYFISLILILPLFFILYFIFKIKKLVKDDHLAKFVVIGFHLFFVVFFWFIGLNWSVYSPENTHLADRLIYFFHDLFNRRVIINPL